MPSARSTIFCRRLVAVVFLSLLVLCGCAGEDAITQSRKERLRLQLVLDADTLRIPVGYETHLNGFARVTSDFRPLGVAGLKLDFHLEQPWLSMNYLSKECRDTTDASGYVRFFLRDDLRRLSHTSTVTVSWGILSASDSIWIEMIPHAY